MRLVRMRGWARVSDEHSTTAVHAAARIAALLIEYEGPSDRFDDSDREHLREVFNL